MTIQSPAPERRVIKESAVCAKCLRCFRPEETCYCKYIKPVESGIKFVFLMHPKEAYKQKTGTGRLACLSLPGSEIIIGIDFTGNRRLKELLSDPQYYPVVMYPGPDAWTAAGVRKEAPHTLKEAVGDKTLLVIIVDATWPCARKMLRLSPNVTSLQKISFTAGYSSEYTFKTEPKPDYLSTIETCYYLLKELNEAGQATSASGDATANKALSAFKACAAAPASGSAADNKALSADKASGAPGASADESSTANKAFPADKAYAPAAASGSAASNEALSTDKASGAPGSVWNGTCDPQPLMDVFRRMVKTQLECQAERIASGQPDRYQMAGGIRARRREAREAAAREAEVQKARETAAATEAAFRR